MCEIDWGVKLILARFMERLISDPQYLNGLVYFIDKIQQELMENIENITASIGHIDIIQKPLDIVTAPPDNNNNNNDDNNTTRQEEDKHSNEEENNHSNEEESHGLLQEISNMLNSEFTPCLTPLPVDFTNSAPCSPHQNDEEELNTNPISNKVKEQVQEVQIAKEDQEEQVKKEEEINTKKEEPLPYRDIMTFLHSASRNMTLATKLLEAHQVKYTRLKNDVREIKETLEGIKNRLHSIDSNVKHLVDQDAKKDGAAKKQTNMSSFVSAVKRDPKSPVSSILVNKDEVNQKKRKSPLHDDQDSTPPTSPSFSGLDSPKKKPTKSLKQSNLMNLTNSAKKTPSTSNNKSNNSKSKSNSNNSNKNKSISNNKIPILL